MPSCRGHCTHYRGAVVQRIVPRSFRRPYPLMMGVALREASIQRAVRYGWSAFIPDFVPPFPEDNSPSPKFLESLNAYCDALNGSDHSQALKAELLEWTTHTYQCVHVAETDAQARRELDRAVVPVWQPGHCHGGIAAVPGYWGRQRAAELHQWAVLPGPLETEPAVHSPFAEEVMPHFKSKAVVGTAAA